jgi:hypothetical protein
LTLTVCFEVYVPVFNNVENINSHVGKLSNLEFRVCLRFSSMEIHSFQLTISSCSSAQILLALERVERDEDLTYEVCMKPSCV